MKSYYYSKTNTKVVKKMIRIFALLLIFFGFTLTVYIFFPLVSWQIYFTPVFASQDITTPIPKTTVVNQTTIGSLVYSASNAISGINYNNAQNWFPTYTPSNNSNTDNKIGSYTIAIPKLKIKSATVSTLDYELDKHLVQYNGTPTPPENGNTVIFGHSTLPQLFNPSNYKTIFANAYQLGIGDDIYIYINNVMYHYKIFSITVVDPTDISVFSQSVDNSYLTLVTCTPPGTTWKRLIIKSRLEKI